MKASELIEQLQKVMAESGDLEVDLFQDEADTNGEFFGICTKIDSDDKPSAFTLCGPDTLDGFRE